MGLDTALEYQNECIRDLLRCSIDPEQIQNVDLLAASIILRTDEEMDTRCHEGRTDKELFLRVTGAFMEAQTPLAAAVPHSPPQPYEALVSKDFEPLTAASDVVGEKTHLEASMHGVYSTSNQQVLPAIPTSQGSEAEGLREACFWIALRQEIHASFMSQRAFTFTLSKFDSFRNLSPTSDAVWADRIVIFHADVLEYCYPLLPNTGMYHDRWHKLKSQATCLEFSLSSSFHPIYFQGGDPDRGQRLPEIWYLDTCHVTAATYIELTKILLAALTQNDRSSVVGT
ncbi:uncharacterized protein Z518_11103 [Rhinocladiella mackenziei CBS 650.93]|uniref:Uncharacterized protein n=1 Tax=Rhinocladiella mackenziei CBS 650.93 TaxID=1442369 RepID=A0A0D2I8W8_9EURO|nr:uncharacterized protein Z518_11103 [Rhinocladiella mackenziei CBS 650.93]KIW99690.1 hypothetical protein Z518_11103 [Rhinocladiella mackenziei CBS 650.93]